MRKKLEEASPTPFSKNSKLSLSLDKQSEMFALIVCSSPGLPIYIKTKVLTTSFILYKVFYKKQKRSGTSPPA